MKIILVTAHVGGHLEKQTYKILYTSIYIRVIIRVYIRIFDIYKKNQTNMRQCQVPPHNAGFLCEPFELTYNNTIFE